MNTKDVDLPDLLGRLAGALEALAPKPPPDPDLAGAEFRAKIAGRPPRSMRLASVEWIHSGAQARLKLQDQSDVGWKITGISDYRFSAKQIDSVCAREYGSQPIAVRAAIRSLMYRESASDRPGDVVPVVEVPADLVPSTFELSQDARDLLEHTKVERRQARYDLQRADWVSVIGLPWTAARVHLRVLEFVELDPRTGAVVGPVEGDA